MKSVTDIENKLDLIREDIEIINDKLIHNEITLEEFEIKLKKMVVITRTLLWVTGDIDEI